MQPYRTVVDIKQDRHLFLRRQPNKSPAKCPIHPEGFVTTVAEVPKAIN